MMLDLDRAALTPDRTGVLGQLGIPPDTQLSPRIAQLYEVGLGLFDRHADPAGVLEDISPEEFTDVYRGEGRNAPAGPVSLIAPRAEHLALFAVTLGAGVSEALQRCFADDDLAIAYMLDAMASVAADQAAEVAETQYASSLRARGWATRDGAALRYSPGYCGWDVTGQKKLFAFLRPEAIGLTLTESCLMQPLKSVSGVLLAGPRGIHVFRPSYDFCEDRTCRTRLRELFRR